MKPYLTSFFLLTLAGALSAQQPGTLDSTFADKGISIEDKNPFETLSALSVQPDGKIVAAGYTETEEGLSSIALLRYLPDGAPDPGFAENGLHTGTFAGQINIATGLALQPDAKILLCGYLAENANQEKNEDFFVTRFLSDGVPDKSFGNNGVQVIDLGESERAQAIRVDALGRIWIAGGKYLGTKASFFLSRLLSDGSPDLSFGNQGTALYKFNDFWSFCFDMEIQPDGKILLAGEGTANTYRTFSIMRVNEDGSLDSGFSGDGMATVTIAPRDDSPVALILAPDGGIFLGGSATDQNNKTGFGLVRLTASGALDATFGASGKVLTFIGDGGHAAISDMILQADGSILAVGTARRDGIFFDMALARYQANGALDPGFGSGGILFADYSGHHEGINAIAVQADGKLLAAGSGVNVENSITEFLLARFFFDKNVGNEEIGHISTISRAFPNPVRHSGMVTLEYEAYQACDVSVDLFTMQGVAVHSLAQGFRNAGKQQETLTLPQGLEPGIYLLRIQSKTRQAFVKINIF